MATKKTVKTAVPEMPPKLPSVMPGEPKSGYRVNSHFPAGLDPEIYIEKALVVLKRKFPWATREHICHDNQYVFEVIEGEYQLVQYFPVTVDKGRRIEYARYVPFGSTTEKKAVDMLACIGEDWVMDGIHAVDKYNMKIPSRYLLGDWRLERVEFSKLENGYYTVDVQAGNSYTGANRTFVITPEYLKGTFEDFLVRYHEIVPPAFGIAVADLAKDEKLKAFLGF